MNYILTKKEADIILNSKGLIAEISLDLGLTKSKVNLSSEFVFIGMCPVPIEEIKKIKYGECWIVEEGHIRKLALFSDESNYYYKLVPSKDWPTVKISSTPMHRHTSISPKEDTISKINEIKPVRGNILDTCCGLGYSAIMASKNADIVYCFEKDKYMLYFTKVNPYSADLYSDKIELFEEDVSKGIVKLKSNFFDRVIHDPPTFKQAPELYNIKFYKELFRVMKVKGILYHYTPFPGKTKDKKFYKGVISKLKEVGFKNVEYHERSSGVVAIKR